MNWTNRLAIVGIGLCVAFMLYVAWHFFGVGEGTLWLLGLLGCMALIVGVYALFILAVVPPPVPMQKCPACAEFVKAEAKVCRYCGERLS